jgi:thiamine transport system permease protein
VLAGGVFAFAVSLGEFGATSVLRRREFATLPVAIFDALGRPGGLGRALALSTILMLVTAASVLAISRLRYREIGEF